LYEEKAPFEISMAYSLPPSSGLMFIVTAEPLMITEELRAGITCFWLSDKLSIVIEPLPA
jgi:hypothetical protein